MNIEPEKDKTQKDAGPETVYIVEKKKNDDDDNANVEEIKEVATESSQEMQWKVEIRTLDERLRRDYDLTAVLKRLAQYMNECVPEFIYTLSLSSDCKTDLASLLDDKGRYFIYNGLQRICKAILSRSGLDHNTTRMINETVKRIIQICSIFSQDTRVSEIYNALSEVFDISTPYNKSCAQNKYAIEFVNAFYRKNGFVGMTNRINDLSRPLTLDEIRDVMRPLHRCSQILDQNFKRNTANNIAEALRARILRVTSEDLRSEKRDAAAELLKILASMLRDKNIPRAYAAFRDISLHLSANLVRLPIFEKRITGIREICSWANDNATAFSSFSPSCHCCSAGNDGAEPGGEKMGLGAWVVRNGILDALFGRAEDVHLEVAKRSKELLAIVAKEGLFGEAALATVLPCCLSGHESVRRTMCAAFADAVPKALDPSSLLVLDNALAAYDVGLFTADYAADLVARVIAAELESPLPAGEGAAWMCPERLWSLAQDGSPLPAAAALAALRTLCGALSNASAAGSSVRRHYQKLAIENLRSHTSPYQAIYLLAHSVPPVPPPIPPNTWRQKQQDPQKPFDLALQGVAEPEEVVQVFLEDCVYYKTDVVSELRDEIAARNGALAPAGSKVEYATDVEERLAFMMHALKDSDRVHLTRQSVEKLWEAFVTNAFTRTETEHALDFFIAASDIPANPMSKDVVSFLFPEMTVTFEPRTVGHKELDFAECFFFKHNAMEGHCARDNATGKMLVSNISLIGTEIFWDICLKTEDRSVGIRAVDAILAVLTILSPDLRPRVNVYRENVLGRCIKLLKTPTQQQQGIGSVAAEGALDALARPQNPLVLSSIPVVTPENRLGVFRTLMMVYKILAGVLATRNDAHNSDTKQLVRLCVVIYSAKPVRVEVVVPQKTTLRQLREKLVAENPNVMRADYTLFLGKDVLGDDAATLLSLGVIADGTTLSARRNISLTRKNADGSPSIPSSPLSPGPVPGSGGSTTGKWDPEFNLEKSVVVTPEAYSLLFKVLAAPEDPGCEDYPCSAIAAMILNMLPTCPTLVQKLHAIDNPAVAEVRWEELVSLEMGPRFVMYFIPSLLAFLHGKCASPSWKSEFVRKGGAAYMVRLFMDCDVAAILGLDAGKPAASTTTTTEYAGGLAENTKCYYLVSDLLCVLEELFITQSGEFVGVPGIDTPRFYVKLLNVCAILCTTGVRLMGSADDDSVSRCFRLIVGVVTKYCQYDVCSASDPSFLANWIRCTLIEAPLAKHREITMQSLIGIGHILHPESDVFQHFINAFWSVLSFVLVEDPAKTTVFFTEYFKTLNALIEIVLTKVSSFNFEECLKVVINIISSYSKVEKAEDGPSDPILKGLFGLALLIVQAVPNDISVVQSVFSPEFFDVIKKFANHVYHRCLFDTPTPESHGPDAPPQCKTTELRSLVFQVLQRLCFIFPPVRTAILAELSERLSAIDFSSVPYNFVPRQSTKAETGYAGLHNLGATCYMNSVLQQLYMVPEFRNGIISVETSPVTLEEPLQKAPAVVITVGENGGEKPSFSASTSSPVAAPAAPAQQQSPSDPRQPQQQQQSHDEEEHLLERLQELFLAMQEGEAKAQSAAELVKTLRTYEGPINPHVQMDAMEFLETFFDKLEAQLAGTPQHDLVRRIFGGKSRVELIPRGCPHRAELLDDFLALPLEVRGKHDLEASLAEWARGDLLAGDNQYKCETCNAKRDTVKRSSIAVGPRVLVVQCKRFAFDFETFRRVKINDKYNFPLNLSLAPYTAQALDTGNAGPAESELKYELVGVVVHMGTADSGHYYSFVRYKDSRWLEFNDANVTEVTKEAFLDKCYGGTETVKRKNYSTHGTYNVEVEKINSAYLLIYRNVAAHEAGVEDDIENKMRLSNSAKSIYDRIWRENSVMASNRYTFTNNFVDFAWKVSVGYDNAKQAQESQAPLPNDALPVLASLLLYVIPRCAAWSMEDVFVWSKALASGYLTCDERTAAAFIERFIVSPTLLESVLFNAPRQEVRSACAEVLCAALANLAAREESTLLETGLLVASSSDMEVEATQPLQSSASSSVPTPLCVVLPSKPPLVNLSGSGGSAFASAEGGALRLPPSGTPKATSARFMDALLRKFYGLEEHGCAFNEYFAIISAFAKAGGAQEIEYLLDRRVVTALLDLFVGNESPSTSPCPQLQLLPSTSPVKRKRTPMPRGGPALAYGGLVGAIADIIGGCKVHGLYALPADSGRVCLSSRDRERLLREDFYERAFGCGLVEEPLTILHNLPGIAECEWPIAAKLINIGFERLPAQDLPRYAACLAKRLSVPGAPQQLAVLLVRDLFVNIICKKPGCTSSAILAAVGESLLDVPAFANWLGSNICEWAPQLLLQQRASYVEPTPYDGMRNSAFAQPLGDVPEKAWKIFSVVSNLSDGTSAGKLLEELLKALKSPEQCNSAYVKALTACLNGGNENSENSKCLEKVEIFKRHSTAFMSVLKNLGIRNQSGNILKYELLKFFRGVLELNSARGGKEDLYATFASAPDTRAMLFGWCITIGFEQNSFDFNEKYVPAYFDLFTRMYERVPDLFACYIKGNINHFDWVIRNLMFSEHYGRPHPTVRDACCRFYDPVLSRPKDRDLFVRQLFDFNSLKSKTPDVLWVLTRFFGDDAPILPDDVYVTIALEKHAIKYLISRLSPNNVDINYALRVLAAFLGKVSFDAARTAKISEILLPLFVSCCSCARPQKTSTAETVSIDGVVLLRAWERLLGRNSGHSPAIVHALRIFITSKQYVLKINYEFLDGMQAFADSVHKLLTKPECGGESLDVAFVLAVLCNDEICKKTVERETKELPKLTRDEVMSLGKGVLSNLGVSRQKIPYCLGVYAKILMENKMEGIIAELMLRTLYMEFGVERKTNKLLYCLYVLRLADVIGGRVKEQVVYSDLSKRIICSAGEKASVSTYECDEDSELKETRELYQYLSSTVKA